MSRSMRVITAVSALAFAAALGIGCGSVADESASVAASSPIAAVTAPGSPSADQAQSAGAVERVAPDRQLLEVIARLVYAGRTWTYEPKGDVPASGGVAGTLVFARIVSVSDDGSAVTFDVVQVAFGDRQARALAQLPGADLNPNAPVCVRNAHVHEQTALLVPGCPAAFVAGLGGSLQSLGPAKVAGAGYCWLVLDGGRIAAMLGQPMY